MNPITTTLWINGEDMDEVARYYCELFGGEVTGTQDYGPDAGQWAGKRLTIQLTLAGQPFCLLNGTDTHFTPNEAVSFALSLETQEDVDRIWNGLAADGRPGPCGWIADRYGFSWQVVPTALYEMLASDDAEAVRRVTACFMQVDGRAFRIDELQAAYAG